MHTAAPLTIRPLRAEELDPLLALYRHLHAADTPLPARDTIEAVWQSMQANPLLHNLGGFVGDTLVCACLLSIVPNLTRSCQPWGQIENVVTHGEYRRRGYAHALLQAAQTLAWQHGCYKLMLLTGRKDEATLRFYESAGFDRHTKQAFYAANPQLG